MPTLEEVATSIQNVGVRLENQMASNGWDLNQPFVHIVGGMAPSITAQSLIDYSNIVSSRVKRLTKFQLDTDGYDKFLGKLPRQLDLIQFNSVGSSPSVQLTDALNMLQLVLSAMPPISPREPKVNWEDIKDEKSLIPQDLKARLRAVDARLKELEPRSVVLSKMIADIEAAHAAADQLPTDLAELAEKRDEISTILSESLAASQTIAAAGKEVSDVRAAIDIDREEADLRLDQTEKTASALITKSEQALRGATSVGLSKSFEARKDALAKSALWWTGGLILALSAAVVIGWERVSSLKDVLNGTGSPTVIVVNAALAILGIGAPVWFAWLSTKQIGTVFRLSEDYAFKASVAQAYEGFRAEAIDIDTSLRDRLFASALDRFEEAPIRLIDPTYHSSPLQELLNNRAVRKALEGIPGIAEKIIGLIPAKALPVAIIAAPVAAATAAVADVLNDERSPSEK